MSHGENPSPLSDTSGKKYTVLDLLRWQYEKLG